MLALQFENVTKNSFHVFGCLTSSYDLLRARVLGYGEIISSTSINN